MHAASAEPYALCKQEQAVAAIEAEAAVAAPTVLYHSDDYI